MVVHFKSNYNGLIGVSAHIQQEDWDTATANRVEIGSEDCGSATDPTVTLNLLAQDGSTKLFKLADMLDEDVFRATFVFRNYQTS